MLSYEKEPSFFAGEQMFGYLSDYQLKHMSCVGVCKSEQFSFNKSFRFAEFMSQIQFKAELSSHISSYNLHPQPEI